MMHTHTSGCVKYRPVYGGGEGRGEGEKCERCTCTLLWGSCVDLSHGLMGAPDPWPLFSLCPVQRGSNLAGSSGSAQVGWTQLLLGDHQGALAADIGPLRRWETFPPAPCASPGPASRRTHPGFSSCSCSCLPQVGWRLSARFACGACRLGGPGCVCLPLSRGGDQVP